MKISNEKNYTLNNHSLQHVAKANWRKVRDGDLVFRLLEIAKEHAFEHFGLGGQQESMGADLLALAAHQKANVREVRVQSVSLNELLDGQFRLFAGAFDQKLVGHLEVESDLGWFKKNVIEERDWRMRLKNAIEEREFSKQVRCVYIWAFQTLKWTSLWESHCNEFNWIHQLTLVPQGALFV